MDAFYQTVTGFCFTLMGLWWAVVQFRHEEWMSDTNDRRLAYSIHLSFLLPGIMSLIAMLSSNMRILWQAAFVMAGLLGILAGIFYIATTKLEPAHGWLLRRARWLVIVIYALVVFFALAPNLATDWFGLMPLQFEGILLASLIFLGVNYAWDLMAEPKKKGDNTIPSDSTHR